MKAKDKKPFDKPEDWNKFLPDFICRCANVVRQKGFWTFGIQNYGKKRRWLLKKIPTKTALISSILELHLTNIIKYG